MANVSVSIDDQKVDVKVEIDDEKAKQESIDKDGPSLLTEEMPLG